MDNLNNLFHFGKEDYEEYLNDCKKSGKEPNTYNFEGKYVRFDERGYMFVTHQYKVKDGMSFLGFWFGSEMNLWHKLDIKKNSKGALNSKGVLFHFNVDNAYVIEYPFFELWEMTKWGRIAEITKEQFETELKKSVDWFNENYTEVLKNDIK